MIYSYTGKNGLVTWNLNKALAIDLNLEMKRILVVFSDFRSTIDCDTEIKARQTYDDIVKEWKKGEDNNDRSTEN
ncbi:MAG: hypothetical protein LBV03_04045 [Fusobacteriales bacterium]|jgi:hypothetical protein|nr:hypothetical protein [Fusobacteriales bacterium]